MFKIIANLSFSNYNYFGNIYIYLHMYVNLFAYSFDKRMIFLVLEKYSSKLPARQCLETLSLLHART